MVRFGPMPASSQRKYLAPLATTIISLLLLCLLSSPLSAQQATLDHAAHVRRVIDNAEQMHLTPAQVGRLWSQLASDYHEVGNFDKAEDAYSRSLRLLEPIPTSRQEYAVTLQNLGTMYMITDRLDAAFNCQKHALEVEEVIGDPILIARGQSHLADVYLAMGKSKQALRYSTSAIESARRLSATPQSDLKWMLIT
jgi:tetratricopeptide (TPR) repeat protein